MAGIFFAEDLIVGVDGARHKVNVSLWFNIEVLREFEIDWEISTLTFSSDAIHIRGENFKAIDATFNTSLLAIHFFSDDLQLLDEGFGNIVNGGFFSLDALLEAYNKSLCNSSSEILNLQIVSIYLV